MQPPLKQPELPSTDSSSTAPSSNTTASPVAPESTTSGTSQPFDPVLEALQRARSRGDVRELFRRHDADSVNAAWKKLDLVDRAALLLCRDFDGTVIRDYTGDPSN